jgi:hypothetical protein
VAKEEELRLFDREDLSRRKGSAHRGFGRARQRQGEPRCDSENEAGHMKRFHSYLLVGVDRRECLKVAAPSVEDRTSTRPLHMPDARRARESESTQIAMAGPRVALEPSMQR